MHRSLGGAGAALRTTRGTRWYFSRSLHAYSTCRPDFKPLTRHLVHTRGGNSLMYYGSGCIRGVLGQSACACPSLVVLKFTRQELRMAWPGSCESETETKEKRMQHRIPCRTPAPPRRPARHHTTNLPCVPFPPSAPPIRCWPPAHAAQTLLEKTSRELRYHHCRTHVLCVTYCY